MTDFSVHTQQTAPDSSKPILAQVEKAYGFVPNLMGTFAESPAVLEGYAGISASYAKSDLSTTERELISMTNSRLNNCEYCMAAHTTVAKMQKVPSDVVEALRNGTPIADPKLEALRQFAAKVNLQRGVLEPADIRAFLAAGYTRANVLEVILGTAMKVMSNYVGHIADTPIDSAFEANTWAEAA